MGRVAEISYHYIGNSADNTHPKISHSTLNIVRTEYVRSMFLPVQLDIWMGSLTDFSDYPETSSWKWTVDLSWLHTNSRRRIATSCMVLASAAAYDRFSHAPRAETMLYLYSVIHWSNICAHLRIGNTFDQSAIEIENFHGSIQWFRFAFPAAHVLLVVRTFYRFDFECVCRL